MDSRSAARWAQAEAVLDFIRAHGAVHPRQVDLHFGPLGVFVQERPNRVSITFTEPSGDRIVGDGKSLWVYLPSSTPGQVLKLPADADGAIVADEKG